MGDRFARAVTRGLRAIERDATPCEEALRAAIGREVIAFDVDGSPSVLSGGARVTLRAGSPRDMAPTVRVRVSRRTLTELARGRLYLDEALLAGVLEVRAEPRAAAALFDAVSTFVEGCARSADASSILTDLSSDIREERT